MDVDVKSIRLDRYYSFPTYVDKFDGSCSHAKEEFNIEWISKVEGHYERIYKGYNEILGAVPSEEQFRIWLCS